MVNRSRLGLLVLVPIVPLRSLESYNMSTPETQVSVAPTKKVKKLKPARKQVKPGDVEKKEAPQTGKEYSESSSLCF